MSDTYSADSITGSGAITAPGSGATVATVAIPAETSSGGVGNTERYSVKVTAYQRGTIDAGHFAALQLMHGSTVVGVIPSTDLATAIEFPVVSPGGDTDLSVKTNAAFAAASVVVAVIVATRLG